MKTLVLKIAIVFLFCTAFSMNAFAQRDENIKETGLKAGIIFPIGDWTDSYGTGFMVGDLSKWVLSPNVRVVGRLEIAFFGGKDITQNYYPGYSYTYSTSPIGILTAGMGFEFVPDPKSGFYGILDFPSMNVIMSGSGLKVGAGIGFGYNFSWGKADLALEVKGNVYNALLTQKSESTMGGLQIGLQTAF
jgi:hypothetical protein